MLAIHKLASGKRLALFHWVLETLSPLWNMTGYKMVGMDGFAPSLRFSQNLVLTHYTTIPINGWLGRDRTYDMRINSALLLPLSY
jgi:hypothetical protein